MPNPAILSSEVTELELGFLSELIEEKKNVRLSPLELRVLLILASGIKDIDRISEMSNLSERVLSIILNKLTALGMVREGSSYHITPAGREIVELVVKYLPEIRKTIKEDIFFSLLQEIVG